MGAFMEITIQAFNAQNCGDLNRCDTAFTVDSMLVLHVQNGEISYTVAEMPPYTKRYPRSNIDVESMLQQEDNGIFFAYCDGQLAGQMILFKNWNGYAYVDDLVVEGRFRRHGVGRRLIDQAIIWAKAHNFPGIMLETQHINVAACRFYERCGFVLGGFDRFLYRGIDPHSPEIALYWYMLFDETA
jgi:streptothricin acetyltransferase